MKSRTIRLLAPALALTLTATVGAVATAQEDAEAQDLIAVSIRLPWFAGSQFAGSYVAQEKGFFADEGLDVTINPGGFDVNSITLVAAGTDTFGLHDTNSLVFASVEEIPLVTVATFLQKHPGAIMALASSGFETLDDLVGARIGFQEGGPWMLTQAMLVKNGIDPDSLEQQTIGFDLTPLFEGQIDLQTVFATTEPIIADSQGIETTVFVPYDYGVETSANALFTSKGYFEENPDVVCSMVRAMARGWEYVFENPDEAAGSWSRSTRTTSTWRCSGRSIAAMDGAVRTPDALENGIGSMTPERWQTTVDVLREFGGLEAEVDLDSVYSDACFSE